MEVKNPKLFDKGKKAMTFLIDNGLKNLWLLNQLKKLFSIEIDSSYLCHILKGERNGPRAEYIMQCIEFCIEHYKHAMSV